MGLLDGLERLITEHGSAAILKERIALLNDRHAAVERDRDQLRTQVAALEAQLQAAQTQIDEVRRLQEDANQRDQKSALEAAEDGHVPDALLRLLGLIAERPNGSTEELAQAAGISLARATLQAETLLAKGLVAAERFDGMPSMGVNATTGWTANVAGLAALDERGLLK